jgi:tRNA (guanine-N7-)-methyltransferase
VLNIKTHYEALDIAQSKQVHYLCFNLPSQLPDLDEQLQQITRDEETVD